MLQDLISDMLTRIRNAQMARHDSVFCYASKFERKFYHYSKTKAILSPLVVTRVRRMKLQLF